MSDDSKLTFEKFFYAGGEVRISICFTGICVLFKPKGFFLPEIVIPFDVFYSLDKPTSMARLFSIAMSACFDHKVEPVSLSTGEVPDGR